MKVKPPVLKTEGQCGECRRWFSLRKESWVVGKHQRQGSECPGSRFAAVKRRFVVRNNVEFKQLAVFLANDNGECLDSMGGDGHTMNCSDGNQCHQLRRDLARAFVVYASSKLGIKLKISKEA